MKVVLTFSLLILLAVTLKLVRLYKVDKKLIVSTKDKFLDDRMVFRVVTYVWHYRNTQRDQSRDALIIDIDFYPRYRTTSLHINLRNALWSRFEPEHRVQFVLS